MCEFCDFCDDTIANSEYLKLRADNQRLRIAIEGAVMYLESTGIQREEFRDEPEHQMLNSFKKALSESEASNKTKGEV